MGPDAEDDPPSPGKAWLLIFAGIILFTVGMMFASFPAGLYTVFGTRLSDNYTAASPVHSIYYNLVFFALNVPINGTLGEVFVVFLAIYLSFLLLALRQGSGFVRALRTSMSDGYAALFSSPFVGMTIILGAITLATFMLDTLQVNAGVSTGGLTGDPFALLVDFTIAPLLEESAYRLIMIGLPIFVMALLFFLGSSPSKAIKVLWRPSAAWDGDEDDGVEAKKTFEGSGASMFPDPSSSRGSALKPVVYFFMILSSVLFGYAHYASGAGWGPGKISEAALAGLALGYLYVKYGFHTNVLLHWSINYVGSIFAFFAQGVWGVPWTSSTGSPLDYVPNAVIIFILGIPSLLIVVNELLKGAKTMRTKSEDV